MKAVAVRPSRREVGLVEHEMPALTSPTEARVRILDVGVCGTDREICAFDYGTPPAGSDYLILGHEALGEVIGVGPLTSRVRPGDLVVPMVRRPCPHDTCGSCRHGRPDFCFTGDFTERGIKSAHGFMTEFIVEDERFLNVIPRSLRPLGVLVEPLTIAEKALIQLWEVQERLPWECRHVHPVGNGHAGRGSCHRAVVLGAGPVGLLGAMALASRGFETTVYSRSGAPEERAALIESFGARFVPAETVSVEQLAERVGRIDLVYEAVGASALAFETMKFLGANGVFVFTGVPGRKGPVEIDTDRVMRNLVLNNQIVLGTVNAGRDAFDAAIRDLESFEKRWPPAIRSLISGRFPIEAHRDLLLGRMPGIKNVLAFGDTN